MTRQGTIPRGDWFCAVSYPREIKKKFKSLSENLTRIKIFNPFPNLRRLNLINSTDYSPGNKSEIKKTFSFNDYIHWIYFVFLCEKCTQHPWRNYCGPPGGSAHKIVEFCWNFFLSGFFFILFLDVRRCYFVFLSWLCENFVWPPVPVVGKKENGKNREWKKVLQLSFKRDHKF